MFGLIERFMGALTKEQVRTFAIKNNVNLSESELDFVYQFVKKNWEPILKNPNLLQLEKYRDRFSEENFYKMNLLIKEYTKKYKGYL